jgi:serine/threonine protein kinase
MDLGEYAERHLTCEPIEKILRESKYALTFLTQSFHTKVFDSGSLCCRSYDYYSTVKVIRNFTEIRTPNVIRFGSFILEGVSYDYIVTERIKGKSLKDFEGNKKNFIKKVEEYRVEMSKISVESMGKLYFLFENSSFGYDIVNRFPCSYMREFHRNPKVIAYRRIRRMMILLRKTLKEYPSLELFKNFTLKQIEGKSRRVVYSTKIGFSFQHCDLHHDNVMVSDEEEVYIVDWDVAGIYPNHYGKARECFIERRFETKDKMIALEHAMIALHQTDDLDNIYSGFILDIVQPLYHFMNM